MSNICSSTKEHCPMQSVQEIAARALACVLFSASAISGQQAAQSSTPAASSTVLRADTNLVLVDVVATDHGKPVLDIAQSRFHVFEDGKERPIASFDQHRPSPASPSAPSIEAQIASLPAHTYTNLPIYPDTGVLNVLLLDALNTPVQDQGEVRRQMIEYMGNIPRGTSMAIFTLATHLQLAEGFTKDAARLAAVLKSKAALPSQSVVTEPEYNSVQMTLEQTTAELEGSPSPPAFTIQSLEQFEADLTVFQTDMRVRMTIDAMDELARYLSVIPGRKNLIWFSGSFPITFEPDANQTSYRNVESYADKIREASDLLTAARVAVYPVDARGLMTSPIADASYVVSPNTMTVSNRGTASSHSVSSNIGSDDTKFMNQNSDEHQSMKLIAEETGGKAFVNSNDLKGAVAEAVEDGDSYYTIGFVPSGKLDGHHRKLKVDVDSGHYDLAYRNGYYADPSNKPSGHNPGAPNPIDAATLHGAPSSTQVMFAARVLPATDPAFAGMKMDEGAIGAMAAKMKGPLRLYIVDFTVDPTTVTFNPTAGDARGAQLEFVLTAYDQGGNRVNYLDRGFQINLSPERYTWTLNHGLRARMALDVPAGPAFLRIAVQDLNVGRVGSLEVSLTDAGK
jgi:VWFA-related protein